MLRVSFDNAFRRSLFSLLAALCIGAFSQDAAAQDLILKSGFEGDTAIGAGNSNTTQEISGGDANGPPFDFEDVETALYPDTNNPSIPLYRQPREGKADGIFFNYRGDITISNPFAEAVIESTNKPAGSNGNVLRTTVDRDDTNEDNASRVQLEHLIEQANEMDEAFHSMRIYVDPNLDAALTNGTPNGSGQWFMFSEHRDWFRVSVGWGTNNNSDTDFKWRVEVYNLIEDNQGDQWDDINQSVATPVGEWFTLETYMKWGPAGQARLYVAMIRDGQPREVIFDITNQRIQNSQNPVRKIMNWQFPKMYTSREIFNWLRINRDPLTCYFDDVEFWTGFPPTHPEGSGGGSSDTTAPPAPALSSPADGSTTDENMPVFSWNSVTDPSGIARYDIELDGTVFNAGLQTSYSPAPLANGVYTWRVRAVDGANNIGAWSSSRSVTVASTGATGGTFSPTADSYVRGGTNAATNYGSDAIVEVKKTVGDEYTRRAFLKFDVSSLSGVAPSAVLSLSVDTAVDCTLQVFAIDDDSWTEGGLTWNNEPATGTLLDSVAMTGFSSAVALDVTDYVNLQSAGDNTVSLMLWQETNADPVRFNTRETSVGPLLIVTGSGDVTGPDAPSLTAPADGTVSSDNTPSFSWGSVSDPSGIDRYDIDIGGAIVDAGTSTSYTPSNGLADGSYDWRVRAVDGAGNLGAWSASREITILTPSTGGTIVPIADAYVRGGTNADTNYGTLALAVKNTAGDSFKRRSFLKFDLSSVSGTATEATLELAVGTANPCTIEIFEVDSDSWTETGITWNNQPAFGALLDSFAMTGSTSSVSLDVTSFVNAENAGDGVVSFMIYQSSFADYISFNSREGTTSPELVVTVSGADITAPMAPSLVTPSNQSSTTDTTPTFVWNSVTDPSGIGSYEIDINGTITNVGNVTSYTAPVLADGLYDWKVRAIDTVGNVSAWSEIWMLNVDRVVAAFEAEDLTFVGVGATTNVVDDTAASGAQWVQLFGNSNGDYVEFTMPNIAAGTYTVRTYYKSHPNRGQYQLELASGTDIGGVQDQAGDVNYLSVENGSITFSSTGTKKFRYRVTGTSGTGRSLSVDRIELIQ